MESYMERCFLFFVVEENPEYIDIYISVNVMSLKTRPPPPSVTVKYCHVRPWNEYRAALNEPATHPNLLYTTTPNENQGFGIDSYY